MRHKSGQAPPQAPAKLNPATHVNDEHKPNHANLWNTESEQTLGGVLSHDKCSQATYTCIFQKKHFKHSNDFKFRVKCDCSHHIAI